METLHWCFIVDTTDGLACEVIKTCQDLLGFVQPKIRGQAARLIFDLTLPLEGKEEACTVGGCIPKLIRLLDDLETFVRAQALAALMRCLFIDPATQYNNYPNLECWLQYSCDHSRQVRNTQPCHSRTVDGSAG